jgi:hypothetical protein
MVLLLLVTGGFVVTPRVSLALIHRLPAGVASTPTPNGNSTPDHHAYMSGLTVRDITKGLEARGLTCQLPQPVVTDPILMDWICTRDDGQVRQRVSIWARDERNVNLIDSSVSEPGQQIAPQTALSLFDQVLALPYSKAQPDLARQAATWVHDHITAQYTITNFGRLTYVLSNFDTGCDLLVSAK